jgi:hypothetical protein
MVAGLAITIGLAAAFYNPAYSQKKGKAQAPTEQGDTVVSKGFIAQHASKTGETISLIAVRETDGSIGMLDSSLVRFERGVILNKHDVLKLESMGSIKRGDFRLYIDKKSGTIYLFEASQAK